MEPLPHDELRAIYAEPFTVTVGGVEFVFDQWWGATLDPETQVRGSRDGVVLTEGKLSGEGSVSTQDDQGDFTFFAADGTAVATLTIADLNVAIDARQPELVREVPLETADG